MKFKEFLREADEVLKATEYAYYSAHMNVANFIQRFGFDPRKYPKYFIVSRNLVVPTEAFIKFLNYDLPL